MTEVARELYGDRFASISRYVDILADRGAAWGLIGPREVDRLWERHILNSAALDDLIPPGISLADIGSGAGLPGLPLALLRPDLMVTLIEPLLRRFNFLTQTVDELGISHQVKVVRSRAEDYRGTFDIVASRALAPLAKLIAWCAPLREPSGSILALKGSSAVDEVHSAARRLNQYGLRAEVLLVRAHSQSEPTSVVRLTGSN